MLPYTKIFNAFVLFLQLGLQATQELLISFLIFDLLKLHERYLEIY